MSGLVTTFRWLSETENDAAIDALAVAASTKQEAIRCHSIDALLKRQCDRCGATLMAKWSHFTLDEKRRVLPKSGWFTPFVEKALQGDEPSLLSGLDAAKVLGLTSLVRPVADLAESGISQAVRESATQTALALAEMLNEQERTGTCRPSQRSQFLSRLFESAKRIAIHRNEPLVDAFLIASTWADSELRRSLDPAGDTSALIARRLSDAQHPHVVALLAEGIRKREVHEGILRALLRRKDEMFRDALLRAVGADPSPTVLRNLEQLGRPRCCDQALDLVPSLTPIGRAALLHVLSATASQEMETLRVSFRVLDMGGEHTMAAFIRTLNHCEVPAAETWMSAAKIIATGSQADIDRDPEARLLMDLMQLLDHPERRMVEAVQRILHPLHAPAMLPRLNHLGRRSRRLLGRIVMMVDAHAIDAVRDALRHPVLDRRLEAISAVEALGVIDLLHEELAHIVRDGHQEARRVTAEILGNGTGPETEALLRELCSMPENAVRDVAEASLKQRTSGDSDDDESEQPESLELPTDVQSLSELNLN